MGARYDLMHRKMRWEKSKFMTRDRILYRDEELAESSKEEDISDLMNAQFGCR